MDGRPPPGAARARLADVPPRPEPRAYADLRAAGLSRRQLADALRAGEWVRVARDAYLPARDWPPAPADQLALRLRSVLRRFPAGTLASHHSAALLAGLPLVQPDPPVHVTVATAAALSRTPGVVAHLARTPPPHQLLRGVPATTLARTVVDLRRALPFREALVPADAALGGCPDLAEAWRAELAACRRMPGAARAARVLAFADPRAESALESVGRAVFHEAGLPPPELQAVVTVGGRFVARVDFLWRRRLLVVELDGLAKYREQGELQREKQRQNQLTAAGYRVLRFTWADVVGRPADTARAVARALDGV